jgi:hypothetical protein
VVIQHCRHHFACLSRGRIDQDRRIWSASSRLEISRVRQGNQTELLKK